jgi:hypothetical protein
MYVHAYIYVHLYIGEEVDLILVNFNLLKFELRYVCIGFSYYICRPETTADQLSNINLNNSGIKICQKLFGRNKDHYLCKIDTGANPTTFEFTLY